MNTHTHKYCLQLSMHQPELVHWELYRRAFRNKKRYFYYYYFFIQCIRNPYRWIDLTNERTHMYMKNPMCSCSYKLQEICLLIYSIWRYSVCRCNTCMEQMVIQFHFLHKLVQKCITTHWSHTFQVDHLQKFCWSYFFGQSLNAWRSLQAGEILSERYSSSEFNAPSNYLNSRFVAYVLLGPQPAKLQKILNICEDAIHQQSLLG